MINKNISNRKTLCACAPHLIEVCIDVLSRPLVQLCAADLLGEAVDADDVGRLQVLREEITTCLGHILHLIPCRKQQKKEDFYVFFKMLLAGKS